MPGLDRPQPTAAVVCCDEVTDDVTNDVIDDLEAGIETKGGPSIWHLMPTYFNKSSNMSSHQHPPLSLQEKGEEMRDKCWVFRTKSGFIKDWRKHLPRPKKIVWKRGGKGKSTAECFLPSASVILTFDQERHRGSE